jgi:hypothetical protein
MCNSARSKSVLVVGRRERVEHPPETRSGLGQALCAREPVAEFCCGIEVVDNELS